MVYCRVVAYCSNHDSHRTCRIHDTTRKKLNQAKQDGVRLWDQIRWSESDTKAKTYDDAFGLTSETVLFEVPGWHHIKISPMPDDLNQCKDPIPGMGSGETAK